MDALADPGRPGRRADRRGGARLGPARLPAPGAAAARRGDRDRRHGTAARCPSSYDDLLALPGVGDYTAAAVASFAFGRRHVVLDTNVRRVLARAVARRRVPGHRPSPGPSGTWRRGLLPDDGPTAATWAVAIMELGAMVCVAAGPRCADCPVADLCAWRRGRLPGLRRAAAPRPDLRRHRPPVPRPAARRCCATATARCTAAASTRPGRRPSSASGASPSLRRRRPGGPGRRRRLRAALSSAGRGDRGDRVGEVDAPPAPAPGRRRRAAGRAGSPSTPRPAAPPPGGPARAASRRRRGGRRRRAIQTSLASRTTVA